MNFQDIDDSLFSESSYNFNSLFQSYPEQLNENNPFKLPFNNLLFHDDSKEVNNIEFYQIYLNQIKLLKIYLIKLLKLKLKIQHIYQKK